LSSVTAPKAKETKVSDENTAAREGADDNPREQEIQEISALARTHGMQEQLPKWIEKRTPLEGANGVRSEIVGVLRDRLAKGPQVRTHAIDLSPKEEQQYSYARAILSSVDGLGVLRAGHLAGALEEVAAGIPVAE
jgi:hypothetical protein